MTILAVDISNGRTKLALAQGARIISDVRFCPTAELTPKRLSSLCEDWHFGCSVLCSVVPQAARVAEASLLARGPVVPVRLHAALPVDFSGYAGYKTLGADRIANVIAAVHDYPDEALVVLDAGTATTLDVVLPAAVAGGNPCFRGGVIAPGVGTMVRALHGGTALLPDVPLSLPSHSIGRNTPEALQNGCVRGYRGLIHELLRAVEQECGCLMKAVLTGGDAPLLAELMPELGTPDPLLTLRGIALFAQQIEKC